MTESLQWHPVSERMPDADETVLVWYVDQDGAGDWCTAWHCGDCGWIDGTGLPMTRVTVTHWAQPKGPQ